jgi:hypothetical protein
LTGLVLGLDDVAANPVRFVPSGLWLVVGDCTSLLCRHCDFGPLVDAWLFLSVECERGRRWRGGGEVALIVEVEELHKI